MRVTLFAAPVTRHALTKAGISYIVQIVQIVFAVHGNCTLLDQDGDRDQRVVTTIIPGRKVETTDFNLVISVLFTQPVQKFREVVPEIFNDPHY